MLISSISLCSLSKKLRVEKLHRGFTLAEVIVSIGIMLVIESIVVYSQSKYSESTIINATITDMSLAVREAQVYGVSVKEFTPGSNEFNAGYGLDFSRLDTTQKTAYISFADRGTRNGVYDGDTLCTTGPTSECISKTILPPGFTISSICEIDTSGLENCTIGRVDITYVRPETDSNIVFFDLNGNLQSFSQVKGVRISITSPNNTTKSIVVYLTGQISIQ